MFQKELDILLVHINFQKHCIGLENTLTTQGSLQSLTDLTQCDANLIESRYKNHKTAKIKFIILELLSLSLKKETKVKVV